MSKRPAERKAPSPLDGAALRRLAIAYVGRYATTRARLRTYLGRKLRERGWAGEGEPALEALAEEMQAAGLIDEPGFAAARGATIERRGFGARRLDAVLRRDGIDEETGQGAREMAAANAWQSALRFAQKRRIGPFGEEPADPPLRQRQFAAMMRAGHRADMVRVLVAAPPGEPPEWDDL